MEEITTMISTLSLQEQITDEMLNQNMRPDHREGWAELNPNDFISREIDTYSMAWMEETMPV